MPKASTSDIISDRYSPTFGNNWICAVASPPVCCMPRALRKATWPAAAAAACWHNCWSTIAWWRELDEPYDGLFYGATLALGFAAGENVYYVLRHETWTVALLRGVFAVPAHALFGASMGYFVGRVKFQARGRAVAAGLSLVVPWALHGAYDLLCSHLGPTPVWIGFGLLSFGMWGFVLWAMNWSLVRSPFRPDAAGPGGDPLPPPG